METDQAVRSTMRYRITAEPEFLKAELFNRQTAEETREFLRAVADECIRRQCADLSRRVLGGPVAEGRAAIADRGSIPLFIHQRRFPIRGKSSCGFVQLSPP